nr:hypothetical protein [Bacillus pumilus]
MNKIYQAVIAKQSEEAERAMITHLEHVEKRLSEMLKEPVGQSVTQ